MPLRCILCTSRKQRAGKIIDGSIPKWASLNYFLGQHVRDGQTHLKNVAKHLAKLQEKEPTFESEEVVKVPCQGISFADESCGSLQGFEEHFKTWLAWKTNCSELRKHNYIYSDATTHYEIKHGDCLKECAPIRALGRSACEKCLSLGDKDHHIRRMVVNSALKSFGARLLHKRLFESEQANKDFEAEVKADILYLRHATRMDKMFQFKDWELQNWVRSSFLSIRQDRRNANLSEFLDLIVFPTLTVNVTNMKQKKCQLIAAQESFQKFLKDPNASDMERVNVAIADASLSGRLQQNPMVLGLVLGCLKSLERAESNKSTKGPAGEKSAMAGDVAQELARDAGIMLALESGSTALLQRFGMSKQHWGLGDFTTRLKKACMPVPFLALRDKSIMDENITLLDQRMSAFTGTTGCDLTLLA